MEAEVAGTDEIKFWVMNRGSHSLVLDPESLREEIRTEAEPPVWGTTGTPRRVATASRFVTGQN